MELILIWYLMTAIITGSIANSKNRNPIGWGMIGFLFNFLGILWIALMHPLEE